MHVIFGAGQVGTGLARELSKRGLRVRIVRRSAAPVDGIEVVSGDARDAAFVAAATVGAEVVYHCMNPSAYRADTWEKEFPALGEALIAACQKHGAKLVCLDNLYGYGETDGARNEDTPCHATGRKGRVRAAWDARLRAAVGLTWAAGRAGDFFGPGAAEQSLVSPAMIRRLAKGQAAWLIGDIDAPHAFSFVPDVVRGLAALGTTDAVGVWHLPVHEITPRQLVLALASAMERSATIHSVPPWGVRVLGPVVPLLGELRETLYQWDRPFLVDDSRFRRRFPEVGATTEQAVNASVEASLDKAA